MVRVVEEQGVVHYFMKSICNCKGSGYPRILPELKTGDPVQGDTVEDESMKGDELEESMGIL